MKRLTCVILLVISSFAATAQKKAVSSESDFVDYLIGNGMAEDAVLYLSRDVFNASDTLEYLRGWADYSAKHLEDAAEHFSRVASDSHYFDKSLFFNVISNAHIGRFDRCTELLDSYSGPFQELRDLETAGIALLRDNPEDYQRAAVRFSYGQFSMKESEEELDRIFKERYCSKGKSPSMAAAASALIPGLGKIYAGELGEGLSSLIVTAAMGAITAENWVKYGPTNWKTLIFGTLGAAFYIGNIYGSYVSVSIHNNDIRNAQDTAVLYHIHIPIRNCFNQ